MPDENKIREKYDIEIKNLELQRNYLLNKIKALNKWNKSGVDSPDDAKELMQILCWQNLSYCCRPKTSDGRGKNCMWRTSVLKLLGISEEEFIKVKEKAVNDLLLVHFRSATTQK